MDAHLKKIMHEKVHHTIAGLKKNNINGYFVTSIEDLQTKIKELIPAEGTIAVGGSQTLFETGTLDFLRSQSYHFYDRYAPGLTAADLKEIHRKAFTADAYLCSVNAVTESGELYSVDGSGNRVAAMIYGPDKIIIIAGYNKIVKNLPDAITRNREVSAPANNVRLNTGTPCIHTGSCIDCKTPSRICCAYVTIGFQRDPNRIHVIFIDGEYGY